MVEQLSAASQQLNPEKVRSGSIHLEEKVVKCLVLGILFGWPCILFGQSSYWHPCWFLNLLCFFSPLPTTKVSNVKKKPTCCTSSHIVHHLQVGAIYFGGGGLETTFQLELRPTWIGFLGEDLKLELIVKAAGKPKIRDHHPWFWILQIYHTLGPPWMSGKKRMQIWLEMPLSLPEYRNDEPSRLCSFRAMEKIRTVSAQTCSGSFIMQMI